MRQLLALLLVLPLANAGCSAVDCGPGTIERNGTCAPAEDTPDPASCGPNTEIGPSGKCEPILDPAICDPNTTMEVLDPDTGIIMCVGTGGGDCGTPLGGCDAAAANTMTVCGRIYDISNDNQIGAGSADTSMCPAGGEPNGACALVINPYDALQFAANPTGTAPLVTSDAYLDHCGRFRFKDIQPAGAPFIGLGVKDNPAQPSANKLTGVAFPTQANTFKTDVVAYVTRTATDMMWTNTAGETTSLAAQGVYVNIFREAGTTGDPLSGTPAAGVQIQKGGSAIPADDYYFSDADPTTRTTVMPSLTSTQVDGSGLVLRQPNLASYSGTTGPLPGGCTWYTSNGAAIPGVVFAQIHPPVGNNCTF